VNDAFGFKTIALKSRFLRERLFLMSNYGDRTRALFVLCQLQLFPFRIRLSIIRRKRGQAEPGYHIAEPRLAGSGAAARGTYLQLKADDRTLALLGNGRDPICTAVKPPLGTTRARLTRRIAAPPLRR
jgi:hypothetical protein